MKRLAKLFLLTAIGLTAGAQTPPSSGASAPKKISDVVKGSTKIDGLFTMYQDTSDGTVHMLVKKDQLDKEYIHFSFIADAPVAAGYFRGAYTMNTVMSIRKFFNRIEFVQENPGFYFDPASPLSRAADANKTRSILSSQKIVAQDSATGDVLIKVDDVFMGEALQQIKPTPNPNARPGTTFSMGNFSKDKSKILRVKNYPANTDVVVELAYDNSSAPPVAAGREITDSRYVTIQLQHSIIEVPKNDFWPRLDDPRVGFFTDQMDDMTSTSATPYRDVINRWNLKKKDPNAAVSEPVEPITWWIENTTPVELRETIRKATLAWNIAFEQAGFRNAVRVEVQPDNATWDAGDIRYNVLRWTSSPQPPFGGYGPSFTNPRTGQILGADVMLEFVYVTNRLNQEKLFDAAALNMEEQPASFDKFACSASNYVHLNTLFGLQALEMFALPDAEKDEYLKQSLYYLVLHEVGHTLGLNHNMKASQVLSPAEINDKSLTSREGLYGSVMDYPATNVSADRNRQGEYFITVPGPYDRWAIEFAYSPAASDWGTEKARLERILSRSTDPKLAFGNDADDMRAPGFGIDPRVMINDLSGDMVTYGVERLKLVNKVLGSIKAKYSKPGQSYHELRNAFLIASGQYNTMLTGISRYVGGVYVDRAYAGQAGGTKPLMPVAKAEQKRAMTAMNTYLFAPDAFRASDDVYNYLQMQRRGFGFFGNTEDPKLTDRVLNMQRQALNHLLNPTVLKRMNDTRLYGNAYSVAEMLNDLTDAIFRADAAGSVNVYRQNLQLEYVNRLATVMDKAAGTAYDYPSKSAALASLRSIDRTVKARKGGDAETRAHSEHVAFVIKQALEPK